MSEMPPFQHTMNPLLDVLREHTAPLAIDEIERRVIQRMALPDELLAVRHDPERPDQSEVAYRIAWARSWLKKAGLVDNPKRGEWVVTPKGRSAGRIDADALVASLHKRYRDEAATSAGSAAGDEDEGEESDLAASEDEASAARVGPVLERQLLDVFEKLGSEGELPTREEVASMLARFRERFGPQALAGLDGTPLLVRMHARGPGKDSLVHWLEFKEDHELSTSVYGSIAGGSALKFGIYQSIESGAWMTGSALQQQRLETDDAVARARQQRDELVAAAGVLGAAGRPEDIDYDALQERLLEVAPTVANSAWGHKVLVMWFPELLDAFHVPDHQAHHLRRLLKLPAAGRYANAGTFAGIARQLGITLLELGRVLVRRNGGPYATWRVGTTVGDNSLWDAMRIGGFAAIGWPKLGDLSNVEATKQGKESLRARLEEHYPNNASTLSKIANQIYNFARAAQERDLVVAMDGAKVLGVGRITGPYELAAGELLAPHRRKVMWEIVGEPWKLPQTEGLLTAFTQLQKHPLNLIEIEARLLGKTIGERRPAPPPPTIAVAPPPSARAAPAPVLPPAPPPLLDKTTARIEAVLARKRQVILYGPPGTGKTHWALGAARELVARQWFGREAAKVTDDEQKQLDAHRAIETVSFHPGYGYEDFLEGFRPAGTGAFELRDGVFKRLCDRAGKDLRRPYVLVVDEINRGDVPRIFGELLTVIERDKRGRPVTLPLSGVAFAVPDNVWIIGTMNTADRSIALLDAALRRRFGFVELLPDTSHFKGIKLDKIPLEAWLDALNEKILEHAGRDARNLRVGHAYFMQSGAPIRELARFAEILRDDVIPLLEEVCYEDFEALERILGNRIVLRAKKRIDVELFDPDRFDALQDAILQAFPNLTTTKAAAEADAPDEDAEEDVTGQGEDGSA